MANPTAAMLVIGDEILSGRTKDSNTNHLAQELTTHGITLAEVRMVPDVIEVIADAVRALSDAYDHVFTSGGIGPTHDDITADAIAEAFGVGLEVREDARALMQAHYDEAGMEFNDARKRMARIPDGATLIENPVSIAPGFTIRNVHVMAGVPAVFEAMVASIVPTLASGKQVLSQSLRILRGEGDIAGPLAELARAHPEVSIGSYPFTRDGVFGSNVVVRSTDGAAVGAVIAELAQLFHVRR